MRDSPLIPRVPPQPEFAVYLLDPGADRPRVVGLLREMTGSSIETCAHLARDVPSLVALCWTQKEADAVVDRFRTVEAVATVRSAHAPEPQSDPAPVTIPGPAARRPIVLALAALGVAQIGLGVWWFTTGRLLTGIAGVLLGIVVMALCWSQLREGD